MHDLDMSVRIGSLVMKNPVTVASGTFGSGYQYENFIDVSRLGAVTTKGVSPTEWLGNAQPRMCEVTSGVLNTIGLQNPGVDGFIARDGGYLAELDTSVIVNVVGHTVDDYPLVIEGLEHAEWIDAYELNISCPNLACGGMAFGTDPILASEVVSSVRNLTTKPLVVKLTPNTGDIASIARAVEEAGADGISLINTIPAMSIDVPTRRPRTSRPIAGLSGPAIKPIAVRMVYEAAQAVSIPIIGMGGIMNAMDAAEFILAGASAVAIGTANFNDPTTTISVIEGLESWARSQCVTSILELRGAVIC